MKIKTRILNAVKVFWYAYKNPKLFNGGNFKMVCDLFALIFKVSMENKPMMTHIVDINPVDESEYRIVSIWAGAGIDSSPTKRIEELLKENSRLRELLHTEYSKNNT